MKLLKCLISNSEKLTEDVYRINLKFHQKFDFIPGQFVNIKTSNSLYPLLRRPISISKKICDNEIQILVKKIGVGTNLLANALVDSEIDLIGPCGNGFSLENISKNDYILIVGGGIGIAPLIGLVQWLRENNYKNIKVINGFIDQGYCDEEFLGCDYRKVNESIEKKFVTEILEESSIENKYSVIFSCGPKLMLEKIKKISKKNNILAQISLEEKMACGVGACLGCAVKIKDVELGYTYKKACEDGPVFNSSEVIFDD